MVRDEQVFNIKTIMLIILLGLALMGLLNAIEEEGKNNKSAMPEPQHIISIATSKDTFQLTEVDNSGSYLIKCNSMGEEYLLTEPIPEIEALRLVAKLSWFRADPDNNFIYNLKPYNHLRNEN